MKKALSLLLASLMIVCIFAGCSNKGDNGTNSSDSSISDSVSDSSTSDDNSSKDSDSKSKYLSWTADDWNNASDKEKEACTLAYLMYIAELMEQNSVTEEMLKPQVENMLSAVDALFQAMPIAGFETLQEAAKAGYEMMQSSSDEE